MSKFVELARRDHLAILTICDVQRRNQLSGDVLRELHDNLVIVRDDEAVKAVVITGQGLFSIGASVKELYDISQMKDPRRVQELVTEANEVANLVEHLGKPTIAAIERFCLGGGNELAMACTWRVATEDAKFAQPEIRLGIMPGMGGTQRLPRFVGIASALPYLLSGEMFTAAAARSMMLTTKIVPEGQLISEVKKITDPVNLMELERYHGTLAGIFSRCEDALPEETVDRKVDNFLGSEIYAGIFRATRFPEACSMIIQAVRAGMKRPLAGALQLEQELFTKLVLTDNAQQGLKTFLDKQAARS